MCYSKTHKTEEVVMLNMPLPFSFSLHYFPLVSCHVSFSLLTLLHVFETLCEIPVLSRWVWADPRALCSCRESPRLSGSPGAVFHTPNWCLWLEMTLSAGFAILNHLKPMWSHPFTLRGIALKCTIASKANERSMLEWRADPYPIRKEKKRYSKMLAM